MAGRHRGGGSTPVSSAPRIATKLPCADDLDRALGGTADRGLVDGRDRARRGAAGARRAHAPCRRASCRAERPARRTPCRRDRRAACSGRRRGARSAVLIGAWPVAGACEIDRAGQRPVILPGRLAVTGDRAVLDRQIRRAAQPSCCGGVVEKQRAYLGAGEAQRDAAELDRLAARRVALVRGQRRCRRSAAVDALGRNVELLGRDLSHRRQNALADLDPARRDGDPPRRVEPHPLIEPRIVRQQPGSAGAGVRSSVLPPRASARRRARPRAGCGDARRSGRYCRRAPARSRARDGAGLRSSNALAEIRMPGRQ